MENYALKTAFDDVITLDDAPSINPKIQQFLRENTLPSPCLVIDMEVVAQNYNAITSAMNFAHCYYAVKSNPATPVVQYLVNEGASFDAASISEINLCLSLGAKPENILFGNTIKKQSDIVDAYNKGIRHFTCDSLQELDKLSVAAPGSKLFCRIRTSGNGAAWPLSKKFGCKVEMAVELMIRAKEKGLIPYGISFHVGSQQLLTSAYNEAISEAAIIFKILKAQGIRLEALDLGGGFPCQYRSQVPAIEAYGKAVKASLEENFGTDIPKKVIIEPGRFITASAGVLQAEVILVSFNKESARRWTYLDIGKYSGLAETEAIQYPIITEKDGEPTGRVILAGPTCDSTDIIYEKAEYYLPLSLTSGDKMFFLNTGAYTTTYASVAFNGFAPLQDYYI